MFVEKCDLCGKELSRGSYVKVGYHSPLPEYALCDDCGAPVLVFLQAHQLTGMAK